MITRDTERLARLEEETPASKGYPSDELDFTKLAAVQEEIKPTQGNPELVIHNPVSVAFGNLPSIDPRLLNRTFQVNTLALLYIAQSAAPEMMWNSRGAIICTGNIATHRGSANFANIAPSKAAQPVLAESMARNLCRKGVHVAYINIDAVVDEPWARENFADKPKIFFYQWGMFQN